MSVPKRERLPQVLNTRYFRRLELRRQLHEARRVVRLVKTSRTKIIAVVSAAVVALVALGAAAALLVHRWVLG
jgi:hypothetical protein